MNKSIGNMYPWVDATKNYIKGECSHKCGYCLIAKTRILMSDFSDKPVEDIKIGDKLIGLIKVDEYRDYRNYNKFGETEVTNISKRKGNTIAITTENSCIECTPEHPLMGSTAIRHCTDWKSAKSFSPYESLRYIGRPRKDNENMLRGWLSGFCDGDGCFFKHYNRRKTEYWWGFEAVCLNGGLRASFIKICNHFGIEMLIGYKTSSKKSFNKGNKNIMVHSRKSENIKKLKRLIEFSINQSSDFYKGYLAGMLDTDGSVGQCVRLSQSQIANNEKFERIRHCLDTLNIKYVQEKERGFRFVGGFKMRSNILFDFKPRHSLKSRKLIEGYSVKGSKHSMIKIIEVGEKNKDVYNLETSCGNFIANGFVVHNCYISDMMKRFNKEQPKPYFDWKELKEDLGSGKTIFVGSSIDMFAIGIPSSWIERILEHCGNFDNIYLFQSKNPLRFREFSFPRKTILGTTIESNRDYRLSKAPSPRARAIEMMGLDNTLVSIEPILDFDLEILVRWIRDINPNFVSIGADSKGNDLFEPSPSKVNKLISELKKITDVRIKDNLRRLM